MISIGSHVYVYRCTVFGNSNYFEVKVSIHQTSALSPLLYSKLRLSWKLYLQNSELPYRGSCMLMTSL